ncbi:IS66 family transposase [Dysgonomonas termitidis]
MEKIRELEELLAESKLVIQELESRNISLESKLSKLTDELLYLRRAMFGRSSERYVKEDPNQLSLAFEGVDSLPEEEKALVEELRQTITYEREARKENSSKPVRQELPAGLERKEEIIEPDPIPAGSTCIGQEVTEILEYTPGTLYVRRIIRKKYALAGHQGVVIAELPSLPLPKSNAGASLLAHLQVSKYQDHLPYYRQIDIFSRQGIKLAASTVNGWNAGSACLLELLYLELRKQVLASDYIQMDETFIPVVDRDKPGATRKGYHWIVKAPEERKLFFHYDHGSRGQKVVIELLKNFKGAVQSDAYAAYGIYENKKDVLLLGCWDHARRRFEQALKNDPARSSFAMDQIQLLYRLERQFRETCHVPDQIAVERKAKAYPILKAFERWLLDEYPKVLPQSLIGKAIAYTYNIYPRLVRYVIDGRYQISNIGAENGLRGLAVGRKNYMFCGSHQAAYHAAIIYSLLGTCRLHGVNPEAWLTDVLNRLPDTKTGDLHLLLPGARQPTG